MGMREILEPFVVQLLFYPVGFVEKAAHCPGVSVQCDSKSFCVYERAVRIPL